MAIVTRTNGDAHGVVHQDVGISGTGIGGIIATGLTKRPTAYKIVATGAGPAAQDLRGEMGPNGAVEAILRVVAQAATITMYQVEDDASGTISVLVEGSGWATDVALRDAVRALGAAAGVGPVDLTLSTAVSTAGFKIA
jgi:hypothetical protein